MPNETAVGLGIADASRAVAVSFSTPNPATSTGTYSLLTTSDGGAHWARSGQLHVDTDSAPGSVGSAAYPMFLDDQHGWVALGGSGGVGAAGDLFATSDGGIHWSHSTLPFGGPVVFSSQSTGWLAGGPAESRLYQSSDSGANWADVTLPFPPAAGPRRRVGEVVALASTDVVVPVQTFTDAGGASTLYFFRTSDQGQSWTASAGVDLPTDSDIRHGVAVVDSAHWYVLAGNVFGTTDAGKSWTKLSGDAQLKTAQELSFGNDQSGEALGSSTTCSDKSNCKTTSVDLTSTDGGRTWVAPAQ